MTNNPTNGQLTSRHGFALTTSLIIVVIIGALVAGTIFTTMFETNVSLNDAAAAQAQYVAQAGLQKYKAVLFQAFRYNEAGGGTSGFECENSLSDGIDILRAGAITPWDGNRIVIGDESVIDVDGNVIGEYHVTLLRDDKNQSRITIVSEGRTVAGQNWRQAQSRATSTYVIRNSSAVEQAIFAGTGHGMKFFNGNTTVYGGVHIVGDVNNPNAMVIDTSGNSRILNAYTTSQTSNTGDFLVSAAQSANNLCASVRVQYGRVNVTGNANFGSSSQPLLTVAIGDEPADLSGASTDCDNGKGNVCAQSVGLFDLWDSAPVFPLLDESPGTEYCPINTWRECIRAEAQQDGMTLAISSQGASTVQLVGALASAGAVLPADCQTALNAAASRTDNALILGNNAVDCSVKVGGRTFGFTYVSGDLKVYGNLNFRGLTLQFDRAVTYTATSRSETGAPQDYAAISIEAVGTDGGDFVAIENFVTASAKKFPSNVLSLVAERDVKLLGGKSSYTLPAYAGREFMTASGSRLFGQAIADKFCTVQPNGKAALECKDKGGSPAEIFFVPTGSNRADSFNAIAPSGGLPTFRIEAYELR